MDKTKNKEKPNQPAFDVGDEIVCKIGGLRGYVILPFRAAVVKLEKGIKIIPEDNLYLSDGDFEDKVTKTFFVKGDRVRIVPTKIIPAEETSMVMGTVIDSKWFYVIHLYRTGEVKVALAEVLMKAGTKILPFTPLKMINLKNLPGQARNFRNN